ncbi:hypothetical protein bcCo53_001542 (plasmid) [Borrelia coriaceae]|uniref:Variable outer membrane protein n=1 Tax=Borrelia coriaceae ATCC 43381 TaxID=1408429 RepID=W5T222_9SPIR|nr:Vsp/OspC family lipoprotein [Borrelia coriaceae]AHH11336.1 Variable outer membrane protein [Borrelia coriaceae ATCC 43381]UPA17355.1 hypothetical protein bcCo53_001542 [Borrelia coriaceae]
MTKHIKSICATLFISLFLSCNNAGPELRDRQAAMADGTIIDLAEVGKKIKEAISFAEGVKEVHALVKSIDELAKGIGKKIQNNDNTLGDDTDKNTSLMAGVYSIGLDIVKKAKALKNLESIKDRDLEQKVDGVISASGEFVGKLRGQYTNLGASSGGTTDANAKNAIDKNDRTGGKGKEELVKLNAAIDELLKVINGLVETSINGLTIPANKEVTSQS